MTGKLGTTPDNPITFYERPEDLKGTVRCVRVTTDQIKGSRVVDIRYVRGASVQEYVDKGWMRYVGEWLHGKFEYARSIDQIGSSGLDYWEEERKMSSTRKHLEWVLDGGDHTHVNAPTAEDLRSLRWKELINLDEVMSERNDPLMQTSLTALGQYELRRLELRDES